MAKNDQRIIKKGAECTIIGKNNKIFLTIPSLNGKGGVASYYNSILPHFFKYNYSVLEIGSVTRRCSFFYPFIDQVAFNRAVKKCKPCLIHINPSLGSRSFFRDGFLAWQAKKAGLPLIVFWHGWDIDFANQVKKKYLWFFKSTFGLADAFIVLSSDFESQLKSWGVSVPIFRETTCVQEELLKDFDIQIKWSKPGSVNPLKVLFLARLDKAKGAFETVNAFKLLGDKGFSVFLTIAGDGPIRNELQMLAKELGLNDKFIQFTGDIRGEKKINAFTEHHIYCFPTYFGEGLPTSVLEAMAFGMPVITRPVGGLKDFFENDKMGYFVETKDPVDIANCLERLLVDYNKMIKIGKYNYRYAQNNFMASVVARRLTAIYDNVLRRVA